MYAIPRESDALLDVKRPYWQSDTKLINQRHQSAIIPATGQIVNALPVWHVPAKAADSLNIFQLLSDILALQSRSIRSSWLAS